jgi:hypothetical protein
MGRHAQIIAVLPDAWGDIWDVRQFVPTDVSGGGELNQFAGQRGVWSAVVGGG